MRRRKRKDEPRIPCDSFADVAFLLIIFFILVTSLHKTLGILTELPQSEKKQAEEQTKTNTVKLNAGKIYFNDTEVTMKELRVELRKLELHDKKDDDKIILFEPEEGVIWQDYFATMATISAEGGVIAIVKEDEEAGEEG